MITAKKRCHRKCVKCSFCKQKKGRRMINQRHHSLYNTIEKRHKKVMTPMDKGDKGEHRGEKARRVLRVVTKLFGANAISPFEKRAFPALPRTNVGFLCACLKINKTIIHPPFFSLAHTHTTAHPTQQCLHARSHVGTFYGIFAPRSAHTNKHWCCC